MVKYFTIMGERCSGTTFLEQAIKKNFELEFIWHYGYKHFYGHYNYNKKNPIIQNDDEVLFLGIIREPISWINSFYDKKYHIPNKNKKNIKSFLFNEFYSIDDNNNEILEDRNYENNERYKNIFEMRYLKNKYLIDHSKKVKNYILIRYEDLKYNYINLLNFIQTKFNLKRLNENFIKINSYKGQGSKLFIENKIKLKNEIIKIIQDNLNNKQEKSLGYI